MGDMRLEANLEFRFPIWGMFHGATFLDVGNVWYLGGKRAQVPEDGVFRLNRFYKQLAMAYGLGIRFDLDYLIIRFDGGMKAINPMFTGKDKYPFLRPNFNRDFTFHFAVGYPF
jgi:outer membrane protein assembly factor BamA